VPAKKGVGRRKGERGGRGKVGQLANTDLVPPPRLVTNLRFGPDEQKKEKEKREGGGRKEETCGTI